MIPASLLSHTLNFDPDDDKSGTVSVPRNVLMFLLKAYLAQQPFDEAAYLQANPDVAIAVQLGDWPSGQAHYKAYGKREWRSPTPDLQSDFEGWRHLFMPPSAPSTR